MFKRAYSHVRANVVGYAALFIALGGTAAAATGLPRNSVGTRQIRNGAVTGEKVARHSLTGASIKASTLGTVPDASMLGHLPASAFQMRVTGGCAPNAAISRITAGGVLQHRLGGSCSAGSAITSAASDGTVSCTSTPVYSEAHTGSPEAVPSAGMVAFDALDASNGVDVSSDHTTYTVSTAGHYEVSVELIPTSGVATNDFFILINNGQGGELFFPQAAANAPATTNRIFNVPAGATVQLLHVAPSGVTLNPGSTLELTRLGP